MDPFDSAQGRQDALRRFLPTNCTNEHEFALHRFCSTGYFATRMHKKHKSLAAVMDVSFIVSQAQQINETPCRHSLLYSRYARMNGDSRDLPAVLQRCRRVSG
jgi:hypothetical protein